MVIITSFWFSTIPVAFLTMTRFIRNRKVFVEKDMRRIRNDPIIIFQITTRSATKITVVERGIYSIIDSTPLTTTGVLVADRVVIWKIIIGSL